LEVSKTGRPTKHTPDREDVLLELIADGMSLVKASKEIDVGIATVFRWLDADPIFRDKYAKAKEAQAEKFADEIVAIADETEVSSVVTPDGEVNLRLDATAVARNRLRVDARKWVASKLLPKKYGDKMQTELSGNVGIGLYEVDQATRMAAMLNDAKSN
jgi:hypothetical protein